MKRSTIAAAGAGAFLAAGLSSCSSESQTAAPEQTQVPINTLGSPAATPPPEALAPADPSTDTSPEAKAATGVDEAMRSALEVVPGTVVAGGRTDEQGMDVWYVTIRADDGSGTEVYVARGTGEVIAQEPESLDPAAAGTVPAVSAEQALASASRAVPGADLVEFDLELEDGAQAWYVFLRGGDAGQREVYISAASGEVIAQGRGWCIGRTLHQEPATPTGEA